MRTAVRMALAGGAIAAALAAAPGRAAAQDLSWSSAAEAAGDEVYLLFTQPELIFGSTPGWRPTLSLEGHYVIVNNGENTWGITPFAGLRYQDSGGFIAGKAGWAIRDGDNGFDPFGGGDNGLATVLHAEYYGDGSFGLQGIASYNWGADFLWSRARALARVAQTGAGGVSLGGEFVWQADTDDDDLIDGNEYEATYLGPVLQIAGSKMIWAFSGGWKHIQPVDDNTWYVKVELTTP